MADESDKTPGRKPRNPKKKGGAPKGNKFAAENHGGRPKLRDRVVLDTAIREAVAKLDRLLAMPIALTKHRLPKAG